MARTNKLVMTKTIADGDIKLSFYSWERMEGMAYTCTFEIMEAFVAYTKLVKGRNGWFISYPSYVNKKGEYRDYIFCVASDISSEIAAAVKEFADEYID